MAVNHNVNPRPLTAEEKENRARGEVCPHCGKQEWTLGYPMGTTTGFVKF